MIRICGRRTRDEFEARDGLGKRHAARLKPAMGVSVAHRPKRRTRFGAYFAAPCRGPVTPSRASLEQGHLSPTPSPMPAEHALAHGPETARFQEERFAWAATATGT